MLGEESVKNEINEMLDTFSGVKESEPEGEPEPEVEPEPNNDPEPEPDPEPNPEPTPEPDEKDHTIAELRRQLEEAMTKKTEEPDKKEPIKEEPKPEPITFPEQDFIGELDPEDIIRDKKAFNLLLNNVYKKGVEDARTIAQEGVLKSIPEIVKNNIELITTLKEASENFYKSNEDLVPFKKVVAAVFEELTAQNPDKKLNDLMELVGPETRKRLGLMEKAKQKEKEIPPKLPQKKTGQRQSVEKPETGGLVDELEAMNKSLGRI